MQQVNRYYKSAKISEAKFRYLLRLFALDLTASDTARLTGLSVRSVNAIYLRLRRRMQTECRVPVELAGAVELDECYFGPRRVRGKRGRGAGGQNGGLWFVQTGRPGVHRNCSKLPEKDLAGHYPG